MHSQAVLAAFLGVLQLCSGFLPLHIKSLRSRSLASTDTEAWDAPAAPAVPESDVVIGEGGELSGAPDSLMGEGQGLTMEWVGKPSPDNPLFQERSPSELAEQSAALDKLAKEWKYARELREYEDSKLLGFTPQSEVVNGRSAMFFIVVGLLTEKFSGESIPSQVWTMLETFGIVGLD